jgi:penicillin-binding protein A
MKLEWRGAERDARKKKTPRPPGGRGRKTGRFYARPAFGVLASFLAISWMGISFLQAGGKESRSPASNTLAGRDCSPVVASFPSFHQIVDGKYKERRGPYEFIYTVDSVLQASVEQVFRAHRPPFGAFVALEPKTGKILALAEYSRNRAENGPIWNRATYPAASVFKIITAACALEKGVLHYDSSVSFKGNQYRLGPSKIRRTSKWEHQTQFDDALGKSNNVVFGRVASQLVGSETLRQYSSAFGFNQPLPFDFPVDPSRAVIPEESYELARCGAGFGEVTLNPIHGALIAAAIANRGIMMRPYLIEEVRGAEGEVLYEGQPLAWAQPISAKTAQDLNRMMRRTVEDGTAARTFQRYGKDLLNKVTVSGKTGSLSGDHPPGLYDWFVGFATAEDRQVALSALAINDHRYKFRGAFIAQEALKTYFRRRLN